METTDLRALSVLLIDDNANMRRVIATILKSAGVRTIYEADEGLGALRIFQSKEVDIIFTDLVMHPVDGLAFVKWVRTSTASPNRFVPIIMMTGHATQRTLYQARMAGVTEFLAKPLTARTVMHRINEIINNPRPFVQAKEYFGPCRRRRIDHDFAGTERRADVLVDVISRKRHDNAEIEPLEIY